MTFEAKVGSDIGVLTASADLSAKQFCLAKVSGVGTVTFCAAASDESIGIIQNTPASGEAVALQVIGISKVRVGAAVTAADKLTSDSAGRAITASGDQRIIGIALETATAADTYIACLMLQGADNFVASIVAGVAAGYKIARGVHTQVAASDTVVTGLATVVAAVASFQSLPTVKQLFCAADVGDQAGAPAAGSILIKTLKPTAVNDVTPTAATDFTENLKLGWIAVGT